MNKDFIGLLWLFTEKFGGIFISTVTFFVYSFYLSPSEFGNATFALAIALVFSQTLVTVLQDPIVCAKRVTKRLISSCLWFNLAVSLVIISVILFGVWLYQPDPELKILIQYASSIILISAINSLYCALLRRQKQFKKMALCQFFGRLVGAVVGIGFVVFGVGPVAMILQLICIELFAVIAISCSFTLKPKFTFSKGGVVELLSNGVPIAIKKISWESFSRGIPIVLGIFTSPAQVGFFAFAWRIIDMPRAAIHNAALAFILPHFVSQKQDKKAIKQSYLFSTKFMCIATVPFFLMLGLFAEPILMLIFSEKWRDAAPLVSMLVIVPILANLRVFAPSLFTSFNKAKLGTKTDVFSTFFALVSCAIAAPFIGAISGVVAFVVRLLINFPITFVYLKSLLGIVGRDYYQVFKSTFLPLFLVLAIHHAGWFAGAGSFPFLQIVIELSIYITVFWMLEPEKSTLYQKLRRKS